MAEWMPIETAPEEGTFLVLLAEESTGSRVHTMVRHPNVTLIGQLFDFDMPKPTHWMPLPAPPSDLLGEGR